MVESQDLLLRSSTLVERLRSVFYSSMEPPQPPPLTSSMVSSMNPTQAKRELMKIAYPSRDSAIDNFSDESINSMPAEEVQSIIVPVKTLL